MSWRIEKRGLKNCCHCIFLAFSSIHPFDGEAVGTFRLEENDDLQALKQ